MRIGKRSFVMAFPRTMMVCNIDELDRKTLASSARCVCYTPDSPNAQVVPHVGLLLLFLGGSSIFTSMKRRPASAYGPPLHPQRG